MTFISLQKKHAQSSVQQSRAPETILYFMCSIISAPLLKCDNGSTEMAKLTAMMLHLPVRTLPLNLFGAIDVLVRSPLPPVGCAQ